MKFHAATGELSERSLCRSPSNRTETMAVPNEDSAEAKLPFRPKDNSSFVRASFRAFHLRPGDWLVPLIGLTLIIVSALVLL
jgi:hypothetical protein